MSLNGVADLYPNTLSGLSTFNANQILINGVDISTIYVPFINSPSDVDLASKNLTTTGRVQTTVLKLPSLTQSSTKFLQLDANKEVISTDLAGTFVVYTGSTANLDMGVFRVFTTAVPSFNNELVNKLYVDTTFPNFGYLSSNYLTQANASIIYAPIASPTFTGTVSGITSSMVGLGNVDNTSDINKPVSTATQTALNLKANIASPTFTGTVSGITSTMVGLGNVDNTSDINKPISTATQNALNLKSDLASPTFTGTVTLPSTVSFTSSPASGSGTLLAINGSNQLITTTSTLNQTSTSTNATHYLTFVASSATGAFTPLVFSQIMCNPSIGLLEVNNIKVTSRNQGGSQTALLACDSSGNIIDGYLTQASSSTNADYNIIFTQYAGSGIFNPLNEQTGSLTYNPSTLVLKTSKLRITSVPTGTQQYLLAVDSSGNVIQGTGAGVSSFSAGSTGLLPSTATTGAIVLTGTLAVANGGTGVTTSTGTTSVVLSASPTLTGTPLAPTASPGTNTTQIATTAFVTTAVSAVGIPTQITPTPINTSTTLYPVFLNSTAGGASTTYVESDGSLSYNPSNNTLTVDSGVLLCNTLRPQFGNSLVIDGNGNGLIVFQSLSVTTARLDNLGLYVNEIMTTDFVSDLNLYASTNKAVNLWSSGVKILNVENTKMIFDIVSGFYSFRVNGNVRFAVTDVLVQSLKPHLFSAGAWLPVDGSTSLYMTDTQPNIATTTYGRFFGVGGAIYQDYYNSFNWRRASNANGTGLADIMSLDANGLTLSNAVNVGQPQLTFAGSGTPNIKATGAGYNWFIGGTQCGYFDTITASAHWRISTDTAQKLILCSGGQNTLQLGNGGLGNYPAEIYGYRTVTGSYWQYTGGGATWGVSTTNFNIGLYVQYTISADGGYLLASDERIKTDIKPAESGSLEVIKTIPIKSHAYIDSFLNGCPTAYNVIAQDIQKYYPEAITISDGFIPDMYVKCRWIHVDDKQIEINIPKAHTVIVGDKVKLILEDSTHKEAIVTAIKDENTFAVEKWDDFKMEISDELFVYGKNVKDFLRVDKIKLGVLALAGVKELTHIVEKQQAKIEEQSQAINTLTESMKFLTEHLAKLTNAFNEIVKEK